MIVRFRDDSGHFARRNGRRFQTAEFYDEEHNLRHSERDKWTQTKVDDMKAQLEEEVEGEEPYFDDIREWENAYDEYGDYEDEEWESSPDYGLE